MIWIFSESQKEDFIKQAAKLSAEYQDTKAFEQVIDQQNEQHEILAQRLMIDKMLLLLSAAMVIMIAYLMYKRYFHG